MALTVFVVSGADILAASEKVHARFVGTTPAGQDVRAFLRGLPENAECHAVTWALTLADSDVGNRFELSALYQVPKPGSSNHTIAGPKVSLTGEWSRVPGSSSFSNATTYRLTAREPLRTLSVVTVGESLLHLLDKDGTLAVGNGGASFTLHDVRAAEPLVDVAVAGTVPDMSYSIAPFATGPNVFAVFEGRTPCHGIAKQLNRQIHAGCTKAKWRLTLYCDPATRAPATYKIEGTLYRSGPREGRWSVLHEHLLNAQRTLFRLAATDREPALLLMKGNEKVLFFLNDQRVPMVGNAEFSYTLNWVMPRRALDESRR